MKKTTWLALLALISLTVAGWLTGCATTEQGAYKVTGSIIVAVDTAMNVWGDYVRAGKATDADQARVRALYEKYQAAMRAEKAAVLTLKNTSEDQALWITITDAVDSSAKDLMVLINTFTAKPATN